jgi:hypothetical protein
MMENLLSNMGEAEKRLLQNLLEKAEVPPSAATLVIRANNYGVERLERFDFEGARPFFSVAIDLMKDVIDEQAGLSTQTQSPNSNEGSSSSSSVPKDGASSTPNQVPSTLVINPESASQVSTTIPSPAVSVEVTTCDDENHDVCQGAGHRRKRRRLLPPPKEDQRESDAPFYIHKNPIYFHGIDPSQMPIVQVSIALMFNLALTCHGLAITSNGDLSLNKEMAKEAIFLYQLAYAIQTSNHIELSHLYTLGIINNVSHLLLATGEQKQANELFEFLLLLLMAENHGRILNNGLSLTTETANAKTRQSLEGFLRNIGSTILPLPPARAA